MEYAIELHNAAKRFGARTLFTHLDLGIEKGEMVAMCGPSGSGKTTLLNIMGLLERLDEGHLAVAGHVDPKANTRASQRIIRNDIAYVFQGFALVEDATVADNLMMGMRYRKLGGAEKRAAVARACSRRIDLAPGRGARPSQAPPAAAPPPRPPMSRQPFAFRR